MLKRKKHILIVLMILFLLTGCYSSEEKKLAEQYKKQGKINAINYVNEKYGFNAKVKSVKEEVNCSSVWGCMDSSPSGDVIVKLNANEKDFLVYITGKEESIDAYDDYQMDEIEKDLIAFFKNNISIDLYDYNLSFNSKGIKEYYDNNLETMLSYMMGLELYYIGEKDLNELNLNKVENFLQTYKGTLDLISFKTKEKCNDYKNAKIENVSLSSANMKNIYKDSSLRLYQGEKTFYNYDNISDYNNEVYVYSSKDDNSYTISSSNLDNLSHYRELYSDLDDKKLEQVTNAYSIPYSSSFLYIYFPKNKVNAKEYDNIFFVSECYVNGEKNYYIDSYFGLESNIKIGSVGNYYIVQERYSQCDTNSEIVFGLIKISNAS